MANGKRKSQQRAARNRQFQGGHTNQERSALRVAQFGQNWQPLPINQFAAGLGLTINFAGFWEISENGMKVEGTDPTSGYTFILDSTRVYYRVQDVNGQYVDREGRTVNQPPYNGNANNFMAASHFMNTGSGHSGQ